MNYKHLILFILCGHSLFIAAQFEVNERVQIPASAFAQEFGLQVNGSDAKYLAVVCSAQVDGRYLVKPSRISQTTVALSIDQIFKNSVAVCTEYNEHTGLSLIIQSYNPRKNN